MMPSRAPVPSPQEEERRFVQPFFVLVVVSLLVMYVYSVAFAPALRDPLRLVAFTILILITGVLHWLFTTLRIGPRSLVLYFVAQGLLSFVITVIGNNMSLALGLYMMLIGEALGAFGINWRILRPQSFFSHSRINFLFYSAASNWRVVLPLCPPPSLFSCSCGCSSAEPGARGSAARARGGSMQRIANSQNMPHR
jgi:hypothetical protein